MLLFHLVWVMPVLAEDNPSNSFCRRWSHSAVVMSDRLYINGGMVTYSSDGGNITNTYFAYHDLNDAGLKLYEDTEKPSNVPSTSNGALWADSDNEVLYSWGGSYDTDTVPLKTPLWKYHISNSSWTQVPESTTQPYGLSDGPYTSSSLSRQGYWLGGRLGSDTDGTVLSGDIDERVTSDLLIYDFDNNSWTNTSGPDGRARHNGAMVFLPLGDRGVLVQFGGQVADDTSYDPGSFQSQPFNEIWVYDIAGDVWYKQQSAGDIPDSRTNFGIDVTWATDKSSYNIYMFGGLGDGYDSFAYTDMWVLSLPSFTWVQLYDPPSNTTHGRWGQTLSVTPNGAQLILVGGYQPLTVGCEFLNTWGAYDLKMDYVNTSASLQGNYDTSKSAYEVPANLSEVIGGDSSGSATATAPPLGWNSRDLSTVLSKVAQKSSASSSSGSTDTSGSSTSSEGTSSTSGNSGLSAGAKAGIAVGVVGAFLSVATVAYILFRRRQAASREQAPAFYPAGFTPNPDIQAHEAPTKWDPVPTYDHLVSELPQSDVPQELPAGYEVRPAVIVEADGNYSTTINHSSQDTSQKDSGASSPTPESTLSAVPPVNNVG